MTNRDEELGIADTTGLTDADWAEINKLKRAYETGGQSALSKAFQELDKDPVRAIRVIGAFFPEMVRESVTRDVYWSGEPLPTQGPNPSRA